MYISLLNIASTFTRREKCWDKQRARKDHVNQLIVGDRSVVKKCWISLRHYRQRECWLLQNGKQRRRLPRRLSLRAKRVKRRNERASRKPVLTGSEWFLLMHRCMMSFVITSSSRKLLARVRRLFKRAHTGIITESIILFLSAREDWLTLEKIH